MENNIPTAESFYDKKDKNGLPMSFNEKMIEFAKYHVEQALKAASEEFNSKAYSEFVLNAYPLTNIK
jgi:hypothetical protein